MNYLKPDRLDALAREYALGTLAGPARRRFERVLRTSRAAALAVEVWQERLATLDLAVVPKLPPASTWPRIEQRLFADARVAALPQVSFVERLSRWLTGRAVAGALAGALMCFALVRVEPGLLGLEPKVDAVSPSYVGLLLDGAGKPAVVLSSRRLGKRLTVKVLQPLAVPEGRVAQLWALPKDGSAPFPVGVAPAKGTAQVALPEVSEKLFFTVSQIAISYEPAAAKPGDRPSAAYALIGHCVKVW
jgi:anti-sigma-K factor RskA